MRNLGYSISFMKEFIESINHNNLIILKAGIIKSTLEKNIKEYSYAELCSIKNNNVKFYEKLGFKTLTNCIENKYIITVMYYLKP